MSVQDLHKLVRDLEHSDPRCNGQQEKLCERIRGFQKMMERAQARELAGYLDTAALLTDYLRVMGGIGPEEVRSIVVRLVKQVEEAFGPQADGAPSGPTESPAEHDAELSLDGHLGEGLTLGAAVSPGGELGLSGPSLSLDGSSPTTDRGTVGGKFLGEILLQLGYVRSEDIDRALVVQRATGIRMGEALVNIGATSYDRIKTALSVQERLTKGGPRGSIRGPGAGHASGPPRPLSL